ncbi:3774_t:CDS:2 [Racocetra fulgida]|uniref:3774_t:CDS:1 n=1 Tax=Racocetra fulgida TaxID=60492 RepID=A0A9N9DY56_9GLOM|nr:3774_t:CDS:2 [Racocetra fulgida]
MANSNNNIGSSDKTQNEYLDEDNKEIEDNEECDLTYISETEFGEYLQGWVEISQYLEFDYKVINMGLDSMTLSK